MNWLNSLLRKPPAPPAVRATHKRVATPKPLQVVDTIALRQALDSAPDAATRAPQEAALGSALGLSLQAPMPGDAPGVWVAAVSQCADRSVALAWLEQVSGEASWCEIACSSRYAEVRLAAAQRITESAALDSVARASKNRDKGVYRHCTDLLRQRRDSQLRLQRAATIAGGLRSLLAQAPLSVTHLLELEREWKALAGFAPQADDGATAGQEAVDGSGKAPADAGGDGQSAHPDFHAQCQALLAQADARILEETEARRGLQALQSSHADLAGQIPTDEWPDPTSLAGWRQRHLLLARALQDLPQWLAGCKDATALGNGLQTLDERLAAWETDSDCVARLEHFLAEYASAASADSPHEALDAALPIAPAAPAPAANLLATWDAMPKPKHAQAHRSLTDRWQALQLAASADEPKPATAVPLPVVASPPEPPPAAPSSPVDLDGLRAQLELLEQALEEGQLAQADTAAKQIKATLGNNALEGRLDARLQRALARLGDLRGWAQWGATKKREDLIDAAATLRSTVVAGTHNVEHLAVAIPALREQWKGLNTQGTAARGQWETFDQALEAAYGPVAAYYAEESERRKQARAVREALLTAWEATLAAIDWHHPDPAAIDAQREQMLAQWRAAPHSGFRDERSLRVRFDTLVRGLDQQVDAARAAEVERREQLIAAVVALSELADPRQATGQAKELQERWRSGAGPMRLRRGEEQKLWQRFRTACDAIFARRDADRASQSAQRQERVRARAVLLETFATVIGGGDADALGRALAQFRTDWEAAGADAGDTAAMVSSQDRQARDLQRQAQQRAVALQIQGLHARYAAMAQAAASTEGVDGESLDKGAAAREELLIDLEIALGLATPGASAVVRRRRQLEQLQNRFRAGPTAAPREQDPGKLLAQWYAIPAAYDAAQVGRIAVVVSTLVERGRAALEKSAAEPARDARRPGPRPANRQNR